MTKLNNKTSGRMEDHFVFNPVDRKTAELFIDQDTLDKIDDAKRQIADAVCVRADEHITVKIALLVQASF